MNIPSNTALLDQVSSPSDLRGMTPQNLTDLCGELRQELIKTVNEVGGHLASSLGVVELTVACHYVFNTPLDRIIWDVGHQAYIHKMLTGRRSAMNRIRQLGGISGFPRRPESPYDTFGVAHAGTSISAATGMLEGCTHKRRQAQQEAPATSQFAPQSTSSSSSGYIPVDAAKDTTSDTAEHVVAIIGDGAMTSGMAFEALNHSGQLHRNLIVILNDNEMSIAPNVGALSWAFSKALSGPLGTSARQHFRHLVEKGLIPHTFYRGLDKMEEAAQGFLSTPAMLFESFGFRYIGPVDGHNIEQLISALERAKTQNSPVLVHALTTKGKGYAPAEKDPVKYHGITAQKAKPLDVSGPQTTQKPALQAVTTPSHANQQYAPATPAPTTATFTATFGQTLLDICRTNPNVVGITAAMPDGTGLNLLAKEMPERYYDVGIAEQHAVTFAAGMACEGMRPVCAIYSTFLQRAFDQVIHDVCIQSLPVIFAIDRGGLVGADGPTHHGAFDLSYLRSLPNMIIAAPSDELELRDLLHTAMAQDTCPFAIRYPRATGLGRDLSQPTAIRPIGKGKIIHTPRQDAEVLLLGAGTTANTCLDAALELESLYGIHSTVVNPLFMKPLDYRLISSLIVEHDLIITVEDNAIMGGFGSSVIELATELDIHSGKKFIRLGIPDSFIEHGTQDELYRICGYDKKSIISHVLETYGKKVAKTAAIANHQYI